MRAWWIPLEIIQLLIVFGLSIIELWAAIPAGFAFNLEPMIIIAVSSAGSIFSAFLVIVIGERLRARIIRWRYGEKRDVKESRFHRIWNKYGIIGLGLLSPLLFGAPLGAALGTAFGARKWRLLLWMAIGIVAWSIGLTLLGVAGINSIKAFFGWN